MKAIFFLVIALTAMCGCSSPSPEYYRGKGSALMRALIKELKASHSREEFMDREKRIGELFKELKALTKEIKTYRQAHPNEEVPLFTRQNQDLSDELQIELNRLLRMEGCRETLNQFLTK